MDICISIPQKNIEKFKHVFLYILTEVGSKPNIGKTVLYKLLYFMDFDYYELYEKQFMGLEYVKKQYGPVPVDFENIINQMKKESLIEQVKSKYFNKDQTKYLPLKSYDLTMFSGLELEHMKKVLEKHSNKTAKEISDFSHRDIPWIAAENDKPLDYESVFYRNELTSVRNYDEYNED